jgi:hypothetical protein
MAIKVYTPRELSPRTDGLGVIYDEILSATLSSWDKTAIPQTYNSLMFVLKGKTNQAANASVINMRINNDSGSVYNYMTVQGLGTGTADDSEQFSQTAMRIGQISANSATANYCGSIKVLIPNYTDTTFFKPIMSECFNQVNTSTNGVTEENEYGSYNGTAAVTRITVYPASGSFIAGTRLTLYGLL